jgi:transcriptional regulator with XRE-family HTH domain
MTNGKPKKLGAVLRCYRLLKELDLRTLGKEIGLSAPTLMRIEQGRSVDAETLLKILNWMLH